MEMIRGALISSKNMYRVPATSHLTYMHMCIAMRSGACLVAALGVALIRLLLICQQSRCITSLESGMSFLFSVLFSCISHFMRFLTFRVSVISRVSGVSPVSRIVMFGQKHENTRNTRKPRSPPKHQTQETEKPQKLDGTQKQEKHRKHEKCRLT